MFVNNLKNICFAIVSLVVFAVGINAQTDSQTSIRGLLKKTGEKQYSIGEYSVQLPADKQDSYNSYFDPYVGKEIDFRGKKIGEKLLEGDDFRDSNHPKPTEKDYPQIARSGKSVKDFIPNGWVIVENLYTWDPNMGLNLGFNLNVVLQEATGDLNNDNLDDVVLAVRGNDLKFFSVRPDRGKIQFLTNLLTNASFSGYDGNLRILIVLLNNGNGYKLFLQNNSFLPVSQSPRGETLEKIEIVNGELKIKFSDGDVHWGFGNEEYKFKYLESELLLVNYDKYRVKYHYDDSAELNYDFLNKTVTRTPLKRNYDKKYAGFEKGKPILRKIVLKDLFNLKTLTGSIEIERSSF